MSLTRRSFCQSILSATGSLAFLVEPPPGFPFLERSEASTRANYMLRYFVRSETASRQTEGLIDYCREHHIQEVILFSGNHWDLGWNLPTLAEAKPRVEVLRPVFKRLREAGLEVSLNMWTTLGHAEIGRDERSRFDWQFMVGDDGAESHTAPCPIDPRYKSYIGRLYGSFASLEPKIIYIDDDFRYHNHRPVHWGCFCPLHLNETARRTGRNWSRPELVREILTAWPQPTEARKHWLALCGDSILELTQIISDAVKAVAPKTHMGLMCSDPNTHAAEGRCWMDMVKAFSVSGNRPVLRPNYASYQQGDTTEAAGHLSNLRKLQPLLMGKMRFTPELENFPFTRFSKSASLTRLQMALSFFLAGPDITLDIHSFVETRFDYDTSVDKMLNESFGFFSGVSEWSSGCPTERGLQILWDDRFPLHRRVESDRMTALQAPRVWEGAMDLMGFATTFYPEEVKLASRSFLEERTAEEMRGLLRGKVLMDGDAASFLVETGYGPQIGLKAVEPVAAANYERMVSKEFAGEFLNRDETVAEASKYRLVPVDQAIIVSQMFGPEGRFSVPGMMLFENPEGGRIGVVPQNGSRGDLLLVDFRGWKRQHVLRKMLEWVNRGPLPLFVENAANICAFRKDGNNRVLVGIANLSSDPVYEVRFRAAPFGSERIIVDYLEPSGKFVRIPATTTTNEGSLFVRTQLELKPLDFACLRLRSA